MVLCQQLPIISSTLESEFIKTLKISMYILRELFKKHPNDHAGRFFHCEPRFLTESSQPVCADRHRDRAPATCRSRPGGAGPGRRPQLSLLSGRSQQHSPWAGLRGREAEAGGQGWGGTAGLFSTWLSPRPDQESIPGFSGI